MKNSSIPYGYNIVRGKAVIDEEQAEKVRQLFSYYLSGLSINNARNAAGLNTCVRTANDMLQREVYTGDDYYPSIIDRSTFNAAAEERAKRVENCGHHKMMTPKDAVGVKTRFHVADTNVVPKNLTAGQKVSFLYSLIVSDEQGSETISSSDRSKLRNLSD